MSKIKLILIYFVSFHSVSAFSISLTDLVGKENAKKLIEQGFLNDVQDSNSSLVLIPRIKSIQRLVEENIKNLDPGIFAESLYLYKKENKISSLWTDSERTAIYNKMLELNTLAGIRYYSHSKKRMRILYESSEMIDHPATQRPLDTPNYSNPPKKLLLYVRQKDSTFGDNMYKYEYYNYPEALVFKQENLTNMNIGIIPMIGKNNLHSIVAITDVGDHLLIYVLSMAKIKTTLGLKQRIKESFSARADALMNWFSGQMKKIDK